MLIIYNKLPKFINLSYNFTPKNKVSCNQCQSANYEKIAATAAATNSTQIHLSDTWPQWHAILSGKNAKFAMYKFFTKQFVAKIL